MGRMAVGLGAEGVALCGDWLTGTAVPLSRGIGRMRPEGVGATRWSGSSWSAPLSTLVTDEKPRGARSS